MNLYGFIIEIDARFSPKNYYHFGFRQSLALASSYEEASIKKRPCPPLGGAEKCPAQNFLRSLRAEKDAEIPLYTGDRKFEFKSLEKLDEKTAQKMMNSLFRSTDMICELCQEMHKIRED